MLYVHKHHLQDDEYLLYQMVFDIMDKVDLILKEHQLLVNFVVIDLFFSKELNLFVYSKIHFVMDDEYVVVDREYDGMLI